MKTYAVFGASGTLGGVIVDEFINSGSNVIKLTRGNAKPDYFSTSGSNWTDQIKNFGPLDGVVWAQGFNKSDSIADFDVNILNVHIDANVTYIVNTLHQMLESKVLLTNSKLIILSSIWQDFGKSSKLSYMTSKSAIRGLVSSLAIDLAKFNISVNAVLPGVIDTPMTRKNLSALQLEIVIKETPLGSLATPGNVAKAVVWLASENSDGITGQFITVDNGWSSYRNV
jgi:NAD(P)-dependent dehydrogenase (short-subunit alcohol dehydrogenase family)